MSIERVGLSFETNFTRIPNSWVRDRRLSRRARGILAELMSHDIGWTITFDSLSKNGPEGRDAIKASLRELESSGYLRRIQNKDADGKFGNLKYEITDPEVQVTGDWKTVNGKSASGKPATKKTKVLKEDQLIEAPAQPDAPKHPADLIAKNAYDKTHGALKYMAVRQVARWAVDQKQAGVEAVERAMAELYKMGKPVTNTTVGQFLDGHIGHQQPARDDSWMTR